MLSFLEAPEPACLASSLLGAIGWSHSTGMLSDMCVGGGLGLPAPLWEGALSGRGVTTKSLTVSSGDSESHWSRFALDTVLDGKHHPPPLAVQP